MNVLVVPEDQVNDRYIVVPVLKALFADLGKQPRITVLPEPRLRGAAQALNERLIRQIIDDNPHQDLFLIIVDGDCDPTRRTQAMARVSEHNGKVLACVAIEEVEVWMLALYKDQLGARWPEVRSHCNPKEAWAHALLEPMADGPGGGRKEAMRAMTTGRWKSLRDLCPELAELQDRVIDWLGAP
ncbi:MAG: hypothetical protein KA297_22425 [Kofleriaceae bacterium]|nr:hypothetical protein [Kofleriaceae bacterium]MBP6839471.1 hypothetical protein [Kofleriaceae bacterium]